MFVFANEKKTYLTAYVRRTLPDFTLMSDSDVVHVKTGVFLSWVSYRIMSAEDGIGLGS